VDSDPVVERALEYFASGFNCAEAVLLSLAEATQVNCACIPRMATGFGGGIGRTGDVCGAISGAVMALGLAFGRDTATDADAKEDTYSKVALLVNAFSNEYGSVSCRDLIGCDLSTKKGQEEAKAKRIHSEICPKFVAFVTAEAWRMLQR